MKTVKWGVLSTADIAQTQLIPAIKRAENAEVIAIASRGPKVHAVAGNLGIARAYESYDALLNDQDVEVIYIPLPNDLHKEWVVKAAKAGKHILCEKPIALSEDVVTESCGGVFIDLIVPENTVYALGDNRPGSKDSRFFGCVPVERIESTAVIRFWPLNKFSKL